MMTDDNILAALKASADLMTSMNLFYSHVISILAKRSGVDLEAFVKDVHGIEIIPADPQNMQAMKKVQAHLVDILLTRCQEPSCDHQNRQV